MDRGFTVHQPLPFAALGTASGLAHLRIMETTDLHVHLAPYDYYADCPNPDLGLVKLAHLIDRARAECPNALLFDNGDFLQGTPVGDYIAYERGLREGDVHPVIAAMNALEFDAITLGNHEFNYGLDFLMTALTRCDAPVVTANLLRAPGVAAPGQDRSLTRPYKLLDRTIIDTTGRAQQIRVGVIGFAPPQITMWERQLLQGRLWARDMVQSAQAWLPEMREAGADIIVALAHTGLGHPRTGEGAENAAVALARLDGIDVVLAGHSHMVFPGPGIAATPEIDPVAGTICGKPAVMAGFWGSHLGVVDLLLQRDGATWHVMGSRSEARALRAPAPPARTGTLPGLSAGAKGRLHDEAARLVPRRSPAVRRAVQAVHRQTLAAIRRPIGATRHPLHSFFALLGRSTATALVAEAKRRYIAHKLEGTEHAGLPVIAAVAPFKAGGRSGPRHYTDISAGPLALRHVSDLYFFPNSVAALRLNGAQIRQWLERSASVFNRITVDPVADTAPRALLNPAMAPYDFEILYGIDHRIDLSQPARFDPDAQTENARNSRIGEIRLNGAPLDDTAEVILCTNSFRANGAAGFAGTGGDRMIYCDTRAVHEVLRHHIGTPDLIDIIDPVPVRFARIPGGKAVFATGPNAVPHLHEIADLNPHRMDDNPQGFMQLVLDFSAV